MSSVPSILGAGFEIKTIATEDAALEPFIQADFDPAEYLNAALPSLSISAASRDQSERASLSELSTKTQILLSQLNAQTSRLSNSLNQLTDEIIRSGSRLAYEVEILRGETNGLTEVLVDKLQNDIALFTTSTDKGNASPDSTGEASEEPQHIQQLRTLAHVRSRLDSVIKVFGDAMQWPVAPSELSSSLIFVTAPNVSPDEIRNREEKGKETAQKLRDDMIHLLESNDSPELGIVAANERINDLRRLALVWKGTAEEKYRTKFIDSLAKIVEEEQRKLAKKDEGRRRAPLAPPMDRKAVDGTRTPNEASYGFMNSLRKIRGDIYVE